MAIKAMQPKAAQPDDEGAIVANNGTVVVTNPKPHFDNIQQAIKELAALIKSAEHAKMRVARVLAAIRDQQLYRDAGVETMKAFLPLVLDQLAGLGIGSATSAKRYLALHDLYLDGLKLPDTMVENAISHLHMLYALAHIDRKSGELEDPEKPGKLTAVQFEDIARLVVWAINGLSREVLVSGADAEQTAVLLAEAGLSSAGTTYREIMGADVVLPPKGWTLVQTQAIIDRVKAQAGEEEEGEDEQVQKVWVGYEVFDGGVYVERIEFRRGEVKLDEIAVKKQYATAHFAMLRGKDAAEIKGADGEQE